MPPDKPLKLLPESVRTFLEFGLKHTVNEQNATKYREQKKTSMLKFVKMTCVSNSYLNCSRRVDLDIYRLNLYFYQFIDNDVLWISLTSKHYDFSKDIYVAHDFVCKLINLLLPPYTGAYFTYGKNENFFEKQSKILKLTKGKIGLDLRSCSDDQFAQKMLELFIDRIHDFRCSIKRFMFYKSFQFPILDYLFIASLENFGQFSYILQHEIKELKFGSISENIAIENGDLVYLKNETIKKLKLDFGPTGYTEFEKLVEYLRKSCSNLKYLDMKANFTHYEFPINQVSDKIVDYVKHVKALKTHLGNYLICVHIKFEAWIHARGQRDRTWIKKVCENAELNGWYVKSDKYIYGRDKLEMAFANTEFKLEMSIIVSYSL